MKMKTFTIDITKGIIISLVTGAILGSGLMYTITVRNSLVNQNYITTYANGEPVKIYLDDYQTVVNENNDLKQRNQKLQNQIDEYTEYGKSHSRFANIYAEDYFYHAEYIDTVKLLNDTYLKNSVIMYNSLDDANSTFSINADGAYQSVSGKFGIVSGLMPNETFSATLVITTSDSSGTEIILEKSKEIRKIEDIYEFNIDTLYCYTINFELLCDNPKLMFAVGDLIAAPKFVD